MVLTQGARQSKPSKQLINAAKKDAGTISRLLATKDVDKNCNDKVMFVCRRSVVFLPKC